MSILARIAGWLGRRPATEGGARPSAPAAPRTRPGFDAMGSYHSADVIRSEGRTAMGGSGDFHQRYTRQQLQNKSRELYRDQCLYSGPVNMLTSYVVGTGFIAQALTEDDGWNAEAEEIIREWSKDCEVRGLADFAKVQAWVFRELVLMGDTAVLKVRDGKLKVIEAEQIAGPTLRDDGIDEDEFGRPIRYHVASYIDGQIRLGSGPSYEPSQICYLAELERPSCIRGVPLLQSAFAMIHRIGSICDAEAIARQIQSRLALTCTREAGTSLAWAESKADPNLSSTEGQIAPRVTEMPEALIFHGNKGEDLKGVERTAPGTDFEETINAFLRLYGQQIGLPLELITLNWTKSNYSQSRAVLEQAFVRYLGFQLSLKRGLHEPIYRWVIGRAIAARKLAPRPDQFKHDWIAPSFPWIDALLETQAWGAKLDRSMATQAQVLKSLNLDPDAVLEQRMRELLKAIARAKEIKQQTGVDVDWRLLAGVSASVNAPPTPEAKNEGEGDAKPQLEKAA